MRWWMGRVGRGSGRRVNGGSEEFELDELAS